MPTPRLTSFHPLWRFGVGLLAIVLAGGYVVSGVYLKQHYENRDERRGLTMTDIQGAYAGVVVPSPLRAAIERGHPSELGGAGLAESSLADADRAALLAWLDGGRVREDYENFDLGEAMPADIIAASCLGCHARSATGDGAYPQLPLEYPDDVFAVAVSREILPKDPAIIVQSLHAHAPSMATVTLVLSLLAGMTRWPRVLVGLLVSVTAAGLLADLSGQYLARVHDARWTWAIVVGGFAASAGVGLLALLVVMDAWVPHGRTESAPTRDPQRA